MIVSYRSKDLQRFVERGDASKLSVPNIGRVERILTELDSASEPMDMNSPGFRFHSLKGQDKGRFAVDASGNWRIAFGWDGKHAIDVDLEDYH